MVMNFISLTGLSKKMANEYEYKVISKNDNSGGRNILREDNLNPLIWQLMPCNIGDLGLGESKL